MEMASEKADSEFANVSSRFLSVAGEPGTWSPCSMGFDQMCRTFSFGLDRSSLLFGAISGYFVGVIDDMDDTDAI